MTEHPLPLGMKTGKDYFTPVPFGSAKAGMASHSSTIDNASVVKLSIDDRLGESVVGQQTQ